MTKEEVIAFCIKQGFDRDWAEMFLSNKPPDLNLAEMTEMDLKMGLLRHKYHSKENHDDR